MTYGQREAFSSNQISLDNESQFFFRNQTGIITPLKSLLKNDSLFLKKKTLIGISTGFRYYKTDIEQLDYIYNESRVYIKSKPIDGLNVSSKFSLVNGNGDINFLYDNQLTYKRGKFYGEISLEKDFVGARSITQNLITENWGLSIDYTPIKNLVIIGGGQYNVVGNDIDRWFYHSKVIYSLPDYNLFFDIRTRNMFGGEWSPLFFSPESISQRQLGIGYNYIYWRESGVIKVYGGGGYQTIDGQTQYLFGVDIKTINQFSLKWRLESQFGIRNFNDYIWSFGEINLRYFLF